MPIQHSLWTVGESPTELLEAHLPSEQSLHQMIIQAPALLSPDWMLIGSEQAALGGRFDPPPVFSIEQFADGIDGPHPEE